MSGVECQGRCMVRHGRRPGGFFTRRNEVMAEGEMQIDERVKFLVDVLNSLPGIETFSSCGGHENPDTTSQCPADEFYVRFTVRESREGMRSLRRLGWATLCFPGGEDGLVDL